MKKWTDFCGGAGLLCLLSGVMISRLAFADNPLETKELTYVVNATIRVGTCTIKLSPSAPPPVIALDADMASGAVQGETEVSVVATDCHGVGAVDKTPFVKVEGGTYDQADPGSGAAFPQGQYLFYSAGSTVKFAGFVLSKTRPGAVTWDENAYVKNNDTLPLGGVSDTCDGLTGCNTTLWVGLACGTASDCQNHFGGGNNNGDLKASINFTFLYN
ncbi:hypothetical protein EYS10_12695 [Rahnella aquatilis]|nr:hypothetical protein EYS10_12695 [Rahnella aquatilis]